MLHWRLKTPKKKDFSLIELLVVVAIIGVLAAVAIPAYNKYRVNAVQAALSSSLNSIGKGFAACLTLNQWAQCDTLGEIDVSCPDCGTPSSNSGNSRWCVTAEKPVGGTTYTGCLETTGGVPTVIGGWVKCNTLSVTYGCATAGGAVSINPTLTCSGVGCTATATVPAMCASGQTTITHGCTTGNAGDTVSSTSLTCTAGQCQ